MNILSEDCRKQFLVLRRNTKRKIEKADFMNKDEVTIDSFNDICLMASKNDPIAQDYLSYIFKKGLGNIIPVNYEKYMQFQILAGANGNNFALDKLALFLNFALNEIAYAEDFEYIATKNELNQNNFLYIVGRLLCEGIIDEMQLNPEKLVKDPIEHIEFNSPLMRKFDKARNASIPKVLKFLRS